MARTERDTMRAKRMIVWSQIEDDYPADYPRQWTFERQAAYQKALRAARVYDHICSPYCLLHGAKRVDRRRARSRAKQLARTGQWDMLAFDFGKRRYA
jgi:hypothetical protein